ncbi:MAG: FecR family protein [Gammaproteobacteria bacterium]|nr:FecR family protein [Gammaproteobacteria bacterium]
MSAAMLVRRWSRDHGFGAQWVLLSFLLLLAALSAGPVLAAEGDPAGRATITLGTVEAIAADGTVRRLGRQDPVFEGDTLRTGPRGRAQIRFTDRGLLSLRPDTEVAIDDYEFDAATPATGRQELNVTRGGFRAATGRIADANRDAWRVRSPLAVIGVRGTIFDLFQQPSGPLTLGVSRGGIVAVTSSGNARRSWGTGPASTTRGSGPTEPWPT